MLSAPSPPEAVIVGGGIAGLASAISLALTGWHCTILEPRLGRTRSGHGLLLPPSSRGALDRLGVAGLERASAPIDAFELCRKDGAPLKRFPIPGSLGLLRRDLMALLQGALPSSVSMVAGRCIGLEADGERGFQVVCADRRRWRAELIVAADGVGSPCRQALFPEARLTQEEVTELVLSTDDAPLTRRLAGRCRKFQDPQAGLAMGLLPCRNGQLVVYAQFATARHPAPAAGEYQPFLRRLFGGWNPLLDQLLQEFSPVSAHLWHTTDLDPLLQLHRGNVVLLGDSAHPMLPFTSQGSSAALEDALRLGSLLQGTNGRDPEALRDALERYSQTRRPELLPIVEEGRALRRLFLDPEASAPPAAPLAGFQPQRRRECKALDPFSDERVPLAALRRQAFNLRWATLPPDVIPLTAADPDFPVAPAVREAIARQAAEGLFSYGPAEGLPAFREACARFCSERRGCPTGPERILAVDSAAAGMGHVCRLLLQPGDEAIVFDPVDFLFQAAVEAAGGTVRRLPVDPLSGALALERLETLLSPRTRLLGVCNPLNPVGRVLRADELTTLAHFAIRHNLQILNDEIWADIIYPPARFLSLGSLDGAVAARCWTVQGFSKNYGLAGLRVGCVLAPDAAGCAALLRASRADTTMSGAATLSQIAAIAALEGASDWLTAWQAHLQRQRDRAVAELATMPGVAVLPPEGTYVLFPRVDHHGLAPEALVERLLQRQRVALVPGSPRWFGPGAAGHLRLVFSTSEGILREGLTRLRRGLEELAGETGEADPGEGERRGVPY
jgi:aspartate/methionine/tyrosine aminotransferase